jgi:hypothetical protein
MGEVKNCNSVQLNSYLYARELYSSKVNYKVTRSREKETKYTQATHKNKIMCYSNN